MGRIIPAAQNPNAFAYTPHPTNAFLLERSPIRKHKITIGAVDFMHLRALVAYIATMLDSVQPDVFVFFAAGSIPCAFAALQRLACLNKPVPRERAHMFPGLNWDREIEAERAFGYAQGELLKLMTAVQAPTRRLTVMFMDTTLTGRTALPRMLTLIQSACEARQGTLGDVVFRIAVLLDQGRALGQLRQDDQIDITRHQNSIARMVWPRNLVRPKALRACRWEHATLKKPFPGVSIKLKIIPALRLFTEDNARLIGLNAITYATSEQATAEKTELWIEYPDGSDGPSLRSEQSASRSIVHVLSEDSTAVFWRTVRSRTKQRIGRFTVDVSGFSLRDP